MQDNRLQLISEVKSKMEEALQRYYKVNGKNQKEADEANVEFQRYKNEYQDLTGELYDGE